MKNKLLKIVSAITPVVCLTFALSACAHEHTFARSWSRDESKHWHAATCEHSDERSDEGTHTFVDGACSVCGYQEPHEHTFAETWSSDYTGHWHGTTCGHDEKKDEAAHTFGGNDHDCTVCGYNIMHFELVNETYTVTGYDDKTVAEITVPATYHGVAVTAIGANAFRDCTNLTSIEIPESVTSIGKDAFDNTRIINTDANWESGVLYIGNYLIKATSEISGTYTVKSGTTVIADYAFDDCNALTAITANGVEYVGRYSFNSCEALETFTPDSSLKIIGDYAFYYCVNLDVSSITDLDGVEYGVGWNQYTKN